jgi:predicted nuclease of predicted toxin-antitoxin system
MATLHKVVWIQRGNYSTDEIEVILRVHHEDIVEFDEDTGSSLLALN